MVCVTFHFYPLQPRLTTTHKHLIWNPIIIPCLPEYISPNHITSDTNPNPHKLLSRIKYISETLPETKYSLRNSQFRGYFSAISEATLDCFYTEFSNTFDNRTFLTLVYLHTHKYTHQMIAWKSIFSKIDLENTTIYKFVSMTFKTRIDVPTCVTLLPLSF